MSDHLIRIDQTHQGVAVVTMCRAEKRNALNVALLHQLSDSIVRLRQDPTCRVLILCGDGPVFCAGLDLVEAGNHDVADRSAEGVRRVLSLLLESPLISIAAALGGAYAGGAGLLAACDLVVADENLRIGFPEVRRGLIAAIVSGVVARKVRDGDLRELLLVGESISAQRAQQIGLVQRIAPSGQVLEHAWNYARSILTGAPKAIRETKMLLNRQRGSVDFAYLQEVHEQVRGSNEAREGLAAFREKRDPDWYKNS